MAVLTFIQNKMTIKDPNQKAMIYFMPVFIVESLAGATAEDAMLPALDEALTRLEALDPEQARIIELRFFGGLSIEEAAAALDISPATLKRRWTLARAWLFRELSASL
jgi:DNA-directed RNA polymerase specialized sigma24 family protein